MTTNLRRKGKSLFNITRKALFTGLLGQGTVSKKITKATIYNRANKPADENPGAEVAHSFKMKIQDLKKQKYTTHNSYNYIKH